MQIWNNHYYNVKQTTPTSITEEVISFLFVNHCAKDINFVDWMWIEKVNTYQPRVEENSRRITWLADAIVNLVKVPVY